MHHRKIAKKLTGRYGIGPYNGNHTVVECTVGAEFPQGDLFASLTAPIRPPPLASL